jgi:anti-sigma B factor antagonist
VTTKVRNVGQVTILDASQRLTPGLEAQRLQSDLERLLAAGHKRILIDLHLVTYIDSSGLGKLLALKKAALVANAELKLLRPQNKIYSLIAESGLKKVFECFDNEKDAIRSFQT